MSDFVYQSLHSADSAELPEIRLELPITDRPTTNPNSVPEDYAVWEALYQLGDQLHARGQSLTSWKQSQQVRDCFTAEENAEITAALSSATNDLEEIRSALEDALQASSSNFDSHMVLILDRQLEAAKLRMKEGCIGDRAAVQKESKSSGLTRDVYYLLDDHEAHLGYLAEKLEELHPEYCQTRGDVLQRVERGEIVHDPIHGYIEVNHLKHIGPDTRISEISKPVHISDSIAKERCPICLDRFLSPQDAVRLTCGHLVCPNPCLSSWVNSLAELCNTCPICRSELFPRRRREPSDYLQRYNLIGNQVHSLKVQIAMLRIDSEELADLLKELDPRQVSPSLGR